MNTWCLDANLVLTGTIEDLYDHFASMNELATENQLAEALKCCIGRTGVGSFIVRTRQGLISMKKHEMNNYFGNMMLRYVSDPVPAELSLLCFIRKKKGLLALVKGV
jgi:hypothetical protein